MRNGHTHRTAAATTTTVILALALAGVTPVIRAQSTPSDPAFEVASVKANKAGDNRVMIGMQPGGRFTATNLTLLMLIRFAYQLQDFQLVGAPDWASEERFDILAKAEGEIAPPTFGTVGPVQLMMRTLLQERFKLAVHPDKRDLPIYAMTLARSDGRLGPQLRPATVDCAAQFAARGRGGPPPGPPPPGERMTCGMRMGFGEMAGGGFPISQLATSLSPILRRIVEDRTGLTGNYEFELKWTPDQLPQRATGTPADQPVMVNGAAIDPNGPSIFTAIQEQLGLKLDAQRAPVDVLVIDQVERPTPD
jgi:uncharacterized protein (TIGR03435 family)